MKIIIAGAGEVGRHLAKLLAKENHDIILMDEDQESLDIVGQNLDILTYLGQPSSISALREVGIASVDLFIGVTPNENLNMTCCMLAKKLGARKTVARIDNTEYTLAENRDFFRSVGIDSLIYPEMLAGQEIVHNLKHSWVRQWWEVQGGQLVLLGVKVRQGADILNKPLRNICGPNDPFHVTAIKRDGDTLMPHGDDVICENDLVFFMTTPEHIDYIRQVSGKEDYPEVRNVFIMGGGLTTIHVTRHLPSHIHAKVFEPDPHLSAFTRDNIDNPNVMVINGDARDPDILREENIEKVEAFVAATENSESNILSCLAAHRFGVRKTVSMIENTDYITMAQSLDIGTILNKKTFAAGHIYRMMLRADVESVKSLTVAAADVAEFHVKEGSRVTNAMVRDLHLPGSVNLGGYVRDGRGYLINGSTCFVPGDVVVAFCLEGEIKKLERYFK